MDLTKLLGAKDTISHLEWEIGGKVVKLNPQEDCTINETEDELDQLRKVSGALYFYGQVLSDIEDSLYSAKVSLKTLTSKCYLENNIKLQQAKARVTDKLLEHLIDTNEQIILLRNRIAELEGLKTKVDTILFALRSKDVDLNELSRRRALELKNINKLV